MTIPTTEPTISDGAAPPAVAALDPVAAEAAAAIAAAAAAAETARVEERLKPFEGRVKLHESNIESLKRELANIK